MLKMLERALQPAALSCHIEIGSGKGHFDFSTIPAHKEGLLVR